MREKGKCSDPWNIALLISVISFCLGAYLYIQSETIRIWCLIAGAALAMCTFAGGGLYLLLNIIFILCHVAVICSIVFKQDTLDKGVVFILFGVMAAAIYFLLRYQPHFIKIDFKAIKEKLKRMIIGDDAFRYLKP